MPEKTNSTKRTVKKSPRAATTRSKISSKKATRTYFVAVPSFCAVLSDQNPEKAERAISYATFAEARSAAIDGLVETIEAAEQQLLALKRAETMNDLH